MNINNNIYYEITDCINYCRILMDFVKISGILISFKLTHQKMKKSRKSQNKPRQQTPTPKDPDVLKAQLSAAPSSPITKKLRFWAIGGVMLAISLIVIIWFLGYKAGIENHNYNPYRILKDYNPEPETISKITFRKTFSNGIEIFDWLMKSDYFQEKEGEEVHPRFISPSQRADVRHKYPVEAEEILNILQKANSSRHAFVVKSAEISKKMSNLALDALKKKNLTEALKDCKIAIDIFPMNAQPYILLTKLYLMTGQEQKMFETLTLAGNSYPNFNNILAVIDDENLDKIPLDPPQDNISLANFPENKKMAISFLFDDGEKNVYTNALPTFEKYGFKATIPIVAGMVADKDDDPYWGSWGQWKDAANRGFEIANHSMYHRDSKELHGSDFDLAIDQSKELIEKNIGHKVTAYVFPHDSYSDEAVSRALREHEVVRSWEFLRSNYDKTVPITYGGPNFSVETANRLVDIAVKRQLWLVANCHGVTEKHGILSFKSITPAFLENHISYIHSRSNDIWVDTFTNVFEYLHLRSQIKIETKDFSLDSTDFTLHNNASSKKPLLPLTVVLKAPDGENIKSAKATSSHNLKAWSCDTDRLCVNVDSYDENIHVQWK